MTTGGDDSSWPFDIGIRFIAQISNSIPRSSPARTSDGRTLLAPGWHDNLKAFFGNCLSEPLEVVLGTQPRSTRRSPSHEIKSAARVIVEETAAVRDLSHVMYLANPERSIDLRADQMPSSGAACSVLIGGPNRNDETRLRLSRIPNVRFDGGRGETHVIRVGQEIYTVEYGPFFARSTTYRKVIKDYGIAMWNQEHGRPLVLFAGCHAFATRAACYAVISPTYLEDIGARFQSNISTTRLVVVSATTRYLADDWPITENYKVEAVYEQTCENWIKHP